MESKKIDKYTVQNKIGQGSFGAVYKGVNTITGQLVALKFIAKKGKNRKDIEATRNESDMLRKLDHENIMKLLDFMETKDQMIIVSQYADTDLSCYLQKQKKLPISRVQQLGLQIMNALVYLHQKRILHRDLKPQNILLKNGKAKICDFGFAKKLSASTNFTNTFKGTPLYFPPQMISHKPHSHKVDIWAFGVILYELFVGITPFHSTSYNALMPKILHDTPKYPKNTPINLKQVVDGCLIKNHLNRYDWDVLKVHPFFKVDVLKNIQNQRQGQKDQKQQKINFITSKVLLKINQQNNFQQFPKIQKDIQSNADMGVDLKCNVVFYHKMISLLGSMATENYTIPKPTLLSILRIIITMIVKVQLPSEAKGDDITKNKDLIFALIKIGEKEKDFQILDKILVALGCMLKNNFDEMSIDYDTDEETTKFIQTLLKAKWESKVYEHCFKIAGILAMQGMTTVSHSQDFFSRLVNEELIETICQHYKHNQSKYLLTCLIQYIHPKQTSMRQNFTLSNKMKTNIEAYKLKAAKVLLKKDFIPSRPILQIYKKDSAESKQQLINYCQILLQLLQVSEEVQKRFMEEEYWTQLLGVPGLCKYCFTFNYVTIKNNNFNFIKKEVVQKYITNSQGGQVQSKLNKAFLTHMLSYYFRKKSNNKQIFLMKTAGQVQSLLSLEEKDKSQACFMIFGLCRQDSSFFNQILLQTLVDVIHSNDPELKPKIENILETTCLKKQKCKLGIQSYSSVNSIFQLVDFVPQILDKKDNLSNLLKLIEECITNVCFVDIAQKLQLGFLQNFMIGVFKIMLLSLSIEEKLTRDIFGAAIKVNFHRLIFHKRLITEHFLLKSLNFINKMLTRHDLSTFQYISIQVMPQIQNLNLAQTPELTLQLITTCSQLAKVSQQNCKALKQFQIVHKISKYLRNKVLQPIVFEKTLLLLGNLTRHSNYFLDQIEKHQIIFLISKFLTGDVPMPVMKNAIFGLGNIAFYDGRFNKQLRFLLPYLKKAMHQQSQALVLNTISTISNLMRHNNVLLQDIFEADIMQKVLEILQEEDKINNKVTIIFSLIRKIIKYPEGVNQLSVEEIQGIIRKKDICKQKSIIQSLEKILHARK